MPNANKELRVTVTPQLAAFVSQKVDSGGYESASEVVREALRVLQRVDAQADAALTAVRAKIDSGMAQAMRGELSDGDAFFDRLEASLEDSRPAAAGRKRSRR